MIRRISAAAPWVLYLIPDLAFAQMPIDGLNTFLDGLLHPLFVSSHLLLLVATGLYYGQQGIRECLPAIKLFVVSTLAGLAVSWFSIAGGTEILILGEALIVGLLVATRPNLKPYWSLIIGTVSGLSLGLDTTQPGLTVAQRLISLCGSFLGLAVLLFHTTAFADWFRTRLWQRTAVRIIGSWVSASALLVLALSLSVNAGS
jgi:urease accessory protein